ncbi:hypothetical protein [Leuconostoc mesenteroides]|nr:hypothetical protein [Leuconostoc mesenteroides]
MTEPVAYMWKTERGTIIGFTPNDNSHSGGQLGYHFTQQSSYTL